MVDVTRWARRREPGRHLQSARSCDR